MANERTIDLTGIEVKVKLSGQNCDIRNDGTDTVYISRNPDIVAGADGVVSVPSGQAVKYHAINGAVYLLGTGRVQLCGNDYAEQVFKCAATSSGEGGTDQTARDAINAHANNMAIHLTADHISNPNLLINPNFSINQRGAVSYDVGVYSVDRWRTGHSITCEVGNNYVDVLQAKDGGALYWQYIEEPARFAGMTATLSICCRLIEGDGSIFAGIADIAEQGAVSASGIWKGLDATATEDIAVFSKSVEISAGINQFAFRPNKAGSKIRCYWAKLEIGGAATLFMPPDPATELVKCQRYYQVRTTGDIDPVDLRPMMGMTPTVIELSAGGYSYTAEI